MKLFEFTKAMIFAIPLGIFTTLTALLLVINAMKVRRLEANYNQLFFFYFACATLSSALFFSYYFFPDFFHRLDIVYCGSLIFTIMLFHRFHCVCIGDEKRFSPLHFVVPAIVVCALLAAKLLLSGYLSYRNDDVIFYVILLFSAYYILLGLYEMHRFYIRQSIVYGSTEAIHHSRVVLLILEKLMFPTVFGLLPFIGGPQPGVLISILLMVAILAALINNIPLVYAIIRYVTLHDLNRTLFDTIQLRRPPEASKDIDSSAPPPRDPFVASPRRPFAPSPENENEDENLPTVPVKRIYRKYTQSHRATGQLIEVDKAVFESYFRKNKPYLNPNLTINDLNEPLHCNRTYLSKFVNRTYGMNFSSYINSCRLREMERLLAMPGNRNKTPATLYHQAGFGSYRNYMNAKNNIKIHTNPNKIPK